MGRLEPPILPNKLYRYRSFARRSKAISEEIACIRENYLWCSDFTCMNDPMEGFYRPSSGLKKKSDYDQILQRITSSKIALGISCFSDTRENILLWTHYAGNYSGICVAYSPSVLVDGLPGNASLIRLGYDDNPPLISSGVGKNVEAAARIILSQKKYNWAYEREWRVLAPKGRVCLERENPVKAVYLGSRISNEHRKQIVSALHGTGIEIYAMEIDGYAHAWLPMNAPARAKAEHKPTVRTAPKAKRKAKARRKARRHQSGSPTP